MRTMIHASPIGLYSRTLNSGGHSPSSIRKLAIFVTITTITTVFAPTSTEAEIVAFNFSGTLDFAYYEDGSGAGIPGVISGVGEGQSYTGTFSFDNQAQLYSSSPGQATYYWTVGTATIDIGGYDYSFIRYGTPGELQTIWLQQYQNPFNPAWFSVNGQDGPGPGGENFSQVSFGFQGDDQLISSLSLSDFDPNPSSLNSGGGFELIEDFQGNEDLNYDIDASVTQISDLYAVPEPSSLVLCTLGLIVLGGRWIYPTRR